MIIPASNKDNGLLGDLALRKNAEGYDDPTAYEAIVRADAALQAAREAAANYEYEHRHKLIGCILRMCELAGYSVEERIVLKDKQTGKIWR